MTARTGGELPRIPGVRYADHVAFTVPDLDQAVQFFVEALGAQELYRSTRGPDAQFMPENFAVPADARLTLAMLRMPPNLNVELFEWSSSDRRTEHPRHSDAGGHHLCFTVADVDQAVAVLRDIPGVRLLGDRKEVAGDSPRVAGNRWTYFLTPWGLLMEIVDRSRVADPPPLVGPADWHTATTTRHQRRPQKGPVTMRIAGHTLGTPEQTVPEALALFAAAGLDAAEVIYQDDYRSGLPLRDRRSAEQARRASEDLGIPIVGMTPYTTGINALDDARLADRGRRVPRRHRDRADRRRRPAPRLRRLMATRPAGPRRPTGTSWSRPCARWRRKPLTPGYGSASRTTSAP